MSSLKNNNENEDSNDFETSNFNKLHSALQTPTTLTRKRRYGDTDTSEEQDNSKHKRQMTVSPPNVDTHPLATAFKTANGKDVQISETALKRAQDLFADIDGDGFPQNTTNDASHQFFRPSNEKFKPPRVENNSTSSCSYQSSKPQAISRFVHGESTAMDIDQQELDDAVLALMEDEENGGFNA